MITQDKDMVFLMKRPFIADLILYQDFNGNVFIIFEINPTL
jgi:hypothetical protein